MIIVAEARSANSLNAKCLRTLRHSNNSQSGLYSLWKNYFFSRYLDDQVLDFLKKIKPLLNSVIIRISGLVDLEENLCILFGHLLPMLGIDIIRRISCPDCYLELLERHFPGILALAKELDLGLLDDPTSIPTYLSWLNAPLNFDQHGPRFLKICARSYINFAPLINALRKVFKS